jgi:ABC-2 type transport system ATP-binding protein
MIRVTDFHKVYRTTVAVAGISFEVGQGEILGLIGPNGAGKTTTLRALAGIIPPTQGRLCVSGHDVVRRPLDAKRSLAYVPDDPTLFDVLTVWEHLQFTAAAYRVPEFEAQAEQLLRTFEIETKRNVVAQELSRGMRQKVAIVCAYLQRPRAMLFDEPLTGLDPRGIRTIKQSILECARQGMAVIVSSHLLGLVEDLCTHLLILHHGRTRFFGDIARARNMLADTHESDSLEEVFFQITHEQEQSVGEEG